MQGYTYFFLISALKHRLWVLVGNVYPQSMFWPKIRKVSNFFQLMIFNFYNLGKICISHGPVFEMQREWTILILFFWHFQLIMPMVSFNLEVKVNGFRQVLLISCLLIANRHLNLPFQFVFEHYEKVPMARRF